MAKKKKNEQTPPNTINKRIERVIKECWIAPVYLSAGITELLNKFNAMSDEDLAKYMDGLIAPNVARQHVKEIYELLK